MSANSDLGPRVYWRATVISRGRIDIAISLEVKHPIEID